MATQSTSVSNTVKDLTSTFSLVEGTQYVLQYQGPDYLRVQAAAAAPQADSTVYFKIASDSTGTVLAKAGENIYAWTDADLGGVVVVDSVS